jgi:electron transfer flavoprotein beta subunit
VSGIEHAIGLNPRLTSVNPYATLTPKLGPVFENKGRGLVDIVNIMVCCKQVIDPEAPPASFKVEATGKTVTLPPSIPPVVDPYSEYAVEAALRIKDAQGCKVIVLSLGTGLLPDVVKKPLSMGADELVLLEDEAFGGGDSYSTACALAMAIKKLGNYGLIFCGRQASDWDAGQVGAGIAEILGLPCVTLARKVEITDGEAKVERVVEDGYEVIKVALPAVITVSNELGEPRYPTVKGIMAVKGKEPTVWRPSDIGVESAQLGEAGRRARLVKLFQPIRESKCEIVDAETPEEAAVSLAMKLREAKIL